MSNEITTDKAKKKPRISTKIREAIDILVAGKAKTVTDAAAQAGISREYLSRSLSESHVLEHFQRKVLRNLIAGAAHAGHTKLSLLGSDNAMVQDRASSYILSLIGINPQQPGGQHVSISPQGRAGWVIDLAEPTRPGLQIVIREPAPPAPEQSPMIDVTPAPEAPFPRG